MVTQTSVRLREDLEKFVESLTSSETTKTDVINVALLRMKEAFEKGIEQTTEIRLPVSNDADATSELREALKKISKEMREYSCFEWQYYHKKPNDNLPHSLSDIPCIQNSNHICRLSKQEREEEDIAPENLCPLEQHKEWRDLIAKHL